jgi:nitrate reductase NapAB chaperone NapD
LVTVYSDTDRSLLFDIRSIPSVVQVDMVLGAFDAIVTIEAEDERTILEAVAKVARTPGVKEAKPLMEIELGAQRPPEATTTTPA